MVDQSKIPKEVSRVTETLQKGGFKAYLVGGCVRDLIIGMEPKDWDVTTSAKPDEIQALFVKTFYENDFGTVGVVNEDVLPAGEQACLPDRQVNRETTK